MSKVVKRSIKIAGHSTSVSLEQEFWDVLKAIAKSQNRSVADLVASVDQERDGGLSSALRVYALKVIQAGQPTPATEA